MDIVLKVLIRIVFVAFNATIIYLSFVEKIDQRIGISLMMILWVFSRAWVEWLCDLGGPKENTDANQQQEIPTTDNSTDNDAGKNTNTASSKTKNVKITKRTID